MVVNPSEKRAAYMRIYRIRNGSTETLTIPVAVLGNIVVNEQGTARTPLTDHLGERLAEILEGFSTYED
jgi:hypothetical protein